MAEKEYIEREALIAIVRYDGILGSGYSNEERESDVIDMIESVPAADVRPVKHGKWTLNKDGSGTCSECGFVQNSCWDLDNWDNFCHHCGADMREKVET